MPYKKEEDDDLFDDDFEFVDDEDDDEDEDEDEDEEEYEDDEDEDEEEEVAAKKKKAPPAKSPVKRPARPEKPAREEAAPKSRAKAAPKGRSKPAAERPAPAPTAEKPAPAPPEDEPEVAEEVIEEPVVVAAEPVGPPADHVVHVYEFRKFKRTINRDFTSEDADKFAVEYNRTSANHSRWAVSGAKDDQPTPKI